MHGCVVPPEVFSNFLYQSVFVFLTQLTVLDVENLTSKHLRHPNTHSTKKGKLYARLRSSPNSDTVCSTRLLTLTSFVAEFSVLWCVS